MEDMIITVGVISLNTTMCQFVWRLEEKLFFWVWKLDSINSRVNMYILVSD